MTTRPTAARPRDRLATVRSILTAAKEVLAEEGFPNFGVNAVARAAGCDKQLIYRYFGGSDGLVDALGEDLAGWWADALAPVAAASPPSSYGELMERMALAMLAALRGDRLVQRIVAWEVAGGSAQVRRLADSRSRGLAEWVAVQRGDLRPPGGIDAPAANAFVIAAIQHLVLAGAAAGQMSGMPLQQDADWDRVEAVVRRVVRALFAA